MATEKNIFEQIRDNVNDLTNAIEQVTCLDPAVDSTKKLTPSKRRLIETEKTAAKKGIYNSTIIEATPNRITTSSEKEIREGNSWIVLGRDRPSGVKILLGFIYLQKLTLILILISQPVKSEMRKPNLQLL
jgi:hypothetical protein